MCIYIYIYTHVIITCIYSVYVYIYTHILYLYRDLYICIYIYTYTYCYRYCRHKESLCCGALAWHQYSSLIPGAASQSLDVHRQTLGSQQCDIRWCSICHSPHIAEYDSSIDDVCKCNDSYLFVLWVVCHRRGLHPAQNSRCAILVERVQTWWCLNNRNGVYIYIYMNICICKRWMSIEDEQHHLREFV